MPSDLTYMIPTLRYQGRQLLNLAVNTFHGVEELNEPFHFTLELVSVTGSVGEISLNEAVGEKVSLEFRLFEHDTVAREIKAVITEVTMLSDDWNAAADRPNDKWRVVLRSPLWLLSLSRRFQVFKDMTASDIARQLLNNQGLEAGSLEASTYAAKSNVQHGESDLEMFQRQLAEEGQLWVDRDGSLLSATSHDTLCSKGQWVRGSMHESVTAFHVTRSATFAKSRVSAHSIRRFDQPFESEAPIKAKGIAAGGTAVVHYPDHHGGNRDGETSQRKRGTSTLIAERATALAQQAQGASELFHLGAGICLDLSGHRLEANGQWLISRIEHHFKVVDADQPPRYSNEFTCVPFKGTTLRPALREPPRIAGLRLGVITNNNLDQGDDEIGGTSASGLYEVRFASEETNAPFTQCMRLAHPWAGDDRGFHFPLEVGDEVVVSHEHGDPGRPFILGCLHNATNKGPAVTTTNGKTTSGVLRSSTGHEVRFDDDPGLKRILLKSGTGDHQLEFHDTDKKTALTTTGLLEEKVGGDHTSAVDGNRTTTIKKNDDLSVEGDRKVAITKGETHTIGEDHSLTISGAENHSVSKDLTQKVDGQASVTIAKDSSLTIKGAYAIDVTKDLTATVSGGIVIEATKEFSGSGKTITLEADDTLTLKCGSAKIVLSKNGDITIDGGKISLKGSGDVAIKGSKTAVN